LSDRQITLTPQELASLEQRLAFRVYEYSASRRNPDSVFALPALRMWLLGQRWPDPPLTRQIELLAVISWWAIRSVEAAPEQEPAIRSELANLLTFLEGASQVRPASLDRLMSADFRDRVYANLRAAANPSPDRRSPARVKEV
jgi:hypothetical protein